MPVRASEPSAPPPHETVFRRDGARDEHGHCGEIGWNEYVLGLPLALGLRQDALDRIVTSSVKIAIPPEIAFELRLPTLVLREGSQERANERIGHLGTWATGYGSFGFVGDGNMA